MKEHQEKKSGKGFNWAEKENSAKTEGSFFFFHFFTYSRDAVHFSADAESVSGKGYG